MPVPLNLSILASKYYITFYHVQTTRLVGFSVFQLLMMINLAFFASEKGILRYFPCDCACADVYPRCCLRYHDVMMSDDD